MNCEGKKYLYDILVSINKIDLYLEDTPDLESYNEDSKTQDAFERRLIIISEAATRLRKLGIVLGSVDNLVNRRNTIVHQYDEFQPRAIWKAVTEEIRELESEVQSLFSE